jgi:predicted permease
MLSELLSDLRYRLRAIFRRDSLERELDAEVHFHIEREAEKYMTMGMGRDAALRQARLAFGGVDRAKEASRDARGVVFLETTFQDVRYALRGLRGRPGFAAAVIVTLGLGIGANAAMFGILDRLLLRAPAYLADPALVHRVYLPWTLDGEERLDRNFAFARYLDLTRNLQSFSNVAAFQYRPRMAVGTGESTREATVGTVSASFFEFFDARPALGRFFSRAEDRVPAGTPVVVLSYPFWQLELGGRTDVLGMPLKIDQATYTIIGVAPESFTGVSDGAAPVAFIPITAYATAVRGPGYEKIYTWSWMEFLVKRKANVTIATATAEMTTAFRQSWLEQVALAPDRWPTIEQARPRALLAPVLDSRGPAGGRDAKIVVWVSGVAVVVLLIACANVANLLLSRAIRRRREIALRLALGVSRGRLMRQLVTESLVLATLGGLAGLAVAHSGGGVLRAVFLPRGVDAGVISDPRTLIFATVVIVATALLTGVAPWLSTMRQDLAGSLKAGGREGTYRRSRLQTALQLIQAALCVVLLVGAGLFVRSFENVRSMRLGYDVDPVLLVRENPRDVKFTPAEADALEVRLLEEAKQVPGVVSATRVASVPFWSNEGRGLRVEGVDSVRKLGRFILQAGSADYFATMGTRIVRGRGFNAADGATAPRVIVISEAMAKVLWPGQEALGKCIRIDTFPCSTVIGLAEEMHVRSLMAEREFTYYVPLAQHDLPATGAIIVRVRGDAADYAEPVRRRLQRLMPGAAYVMARPLRELVDPNLRSWRFGATMFAAFGLLALALAAIGLYSVIAYNVAQRTQELGLRIALGAKAGNVLRLIIGRGVGLTLAGVVIGSALAIWASKWAEPLLYNQKPRDPVVLGAVAFVLLAVAALASAIPAMRATRVDPNIALRAE